MQLQKIKDEVRFYLRDTGATFYYTDEILDRLILRSQNETIKDFFLNEQAATIEKLKVFQSQILGLRVLNENNQAVDVDSTFQAINPRGEKLKVIVNLAVTEFDEEMPDVFESYIVFKTLETLYLTQVNKDDLTRSQYINAKIQQLKKELLEFVNFLKFGTAILRKGE